MWLCLSLETQRCPKAPSLGTDKHSAFAHRGPAAPLLHPPSSP